MAHLPIHIRIKGIVVVNHFAISWLPMKRTPKKEVGAGGQKVTTLWGTAFGPRGRRLQGHPPPQPEVPPEVAMRTGALRRSLCRWIRTMN